MTDEQQRIFYENGFSVLIRLDNVTIASDHDGYLGIMPVGNGVMVHKRLLASIARWLDSNIARDALALPRVMRVNRAGEPLEISSSPP